jgi:hypothetical protein
MRRPVRLQQTRMHTRLKSTQEVLELAVLLIKQNVLDMSGPRVESTELLVQ